MASEKPDFPTELTLNEKSVEILITKLVPTSQYFEARFDGLEQKLDLKVDNLQLQINTLSEGQQKIREEIGEFKKNVDKRFEQVDQKLDRILERIDTKIDNGLRENRAIGIRLFTFAMMFSAVSMVGVLGKITGLF